MTSLNIARVSCDGYVCLTHNGNRSHFGRNRFAVVVQRTGHGGCHAVHSIERFGTWLHNELRMKVSPLSGPAHAHKVEDVEGEPEDAEQRAPRSRAGVDPAAE
jgi:hypothetical protein